MKMTDPSNPLLFFGIDVQAAARGCPYAVVDCTGSPWILAGRAEVPGMW